MELQNDLPTDDASVETPHLNGFATLPKSTGSTNLEHSQDITSLQSNQPDDGKSVSEQPEVATLLHLFKDVYQQRVTDIENNESFDLNRKNKEILVILQSYLQQLQEQNDVLVSTMIELEKEAQQRVKQMEKRLKSSAKTTMEAVINVHECEKEMRRLVEERLYIESLFTNMQQHLSSVKVENSFLRDQNFNLNHDVQALLHVIHHARSTGHWEMNCVTFCEVTPEQVFGPVQSISQMYSAESPQSDFQLPEAEGKTNSELSSQEVSHSSMSSPSINNPLGINPADESINAKFLQEDVRNELLEKDKKIAMLESHLSELRHQLTIKEAECECHMWKLESLMQQNQNQDVFPPVLPTGDVSLQKCISLPDIGNIYSYANIIRKSYSCRTLGNAPKLCIRLAQRNSAYNIRPTHTSERSVSRLCKFLNKKYEHVYGFRRAQSEPHLFMFGDNVYVYRPCEPIKKASNVALHDDYQLSLPPCQSIDLKFPTDDSNLKVYDWDLMRKNVCHPVPDTSYHKVDGSSSSCGSSDSEAMEHSKDILCNINSPIHIHHSTCVPSVHSRCVKCCHQKVGSYDVMNSNEKCSFSENYSDLVSTSIQTEEKKIVSNSIGLQADLDVNIKNNQDLINENGFLEMDLSQIKKRMHALKDSVVKAEDKAEAKGILIEQLQNHLTSAVKEVELKDKALSNVEKKLQLSRNECTSLKNQICNLNSEIQLIFKDLEDARMLNDNLSLKVDAKDEKIEEMSRDQKMLQNQKRALMTQLDAQGDELESTKKELEGMKLKTETCVLQMEQQSQIIKSLQEALVQSKRAFDAAYPKMPLFSGSATSNLQTETKHSSKSSIVDI